MKDTYIRGACGNSRRIRGLVEIKHGQNRSKYIKIPVIHQTINFQAAGETRQHVEPIWKVCHCQRIQQTTRKLLQLVAGYIIILYWMIEHLIGKGGRSLRQEPSLQIPVLRSNHAHIYLFVCVNSPFVCILHPI